MAQTESLLATFAHALFDHGERMKHNPHVIQLAQEPHVRINPGEGSKRGIQSGDTVHINNLIHAKVMLDARVADGTIVLPLGFEEVPVHELGTQLLNGLPITIEKISKDQI